MHRRPIRVVIMTTAPEALACFLSAHVRTLVAGGYEVHTISSPGICDLGWEFPGGNTHHELPMRRNLAPIADFRSLFLLLRLLRRIRPDIVQTHTPKAGLLGMVAAWVGRVPVRIYTVNGLPIRVQRAFGALVLGITERIACGLATQVVCVSRSARRFIIAMRFCSGKKCRVLGDGGSHGVDTGRFTPRSQGSYERTSARRRLSIPDDALVLGYVGRVVPAKGIHELALAWRMLRDRHANLRLLLCGYCERDHPLNPSVLEELRNDARVHFTPDRIIDMPPIYGAIDIAVLPTYCEGLPNFALEASAMEVPMVASRVPGCVDAIRDGSTGMLVPPKDPAALAEAIDYLIENPQCRERMGKAARRYVQRRFSEGRITQLLLDQYEQLSTWIRNAGFRLGPAASPPVGGRVASGRE